MFGVTKRSAFIQFRHPLQQLCSLFDIPIVERCLVYLSRYFKKTSKSHTLFTDLSPVFFQSMLLLKKLLLLLSILLPLEHSNMLFELATSLYFSELFYREATFKLKESLSVMQFSVFGALLGGCFACLESAPIMILSPNARNIFPLREWFTSVGIP